MATTMLHLSGDLLKHFIPMKGICRYLVQRFLGHLVQQKWTDEQFGGSLKEGFTVKMIRLNSKLLTDVLQNKLNSPLEVIDGFIDCITFKFPSESWESLITKSTEISVSHLQLSIRLVDTDVDVETDINRLIDSMSASMTGLGDEYLSANKEEALNDSGEQSLEIITKVINNLFFKLKLKLEDTVIRLEKPTSISTGLTESVDDDESGFALELRIKDIELHDEHLDSKDQVDLSTEDSTTRKNLDVLCSPKVAKLRGFEVFTDAYHFCRSNGRSDNEASIFKSAISSISASSFFSASAGGNFYSCPLKIAELRGTQSVRLKLSPTADSIVTTDTTAGAQTTAFKDVQYNLQLDFTIDWLSIFLAPCQVYAAADLLSTFQQPANQFAATQAGPNGGGGLTTRKMTQSDHDRITAELERTSGRRESDEPPPPLLNSDPLIEELDTRSVRTMRPPSIAGTAETPYASCSASTLADDTLSTTTALTDDTLQSAAHLLRAGGGRCANATTTATSRAKYSRINVQAMYVSLVVLSENPTLDKEEFEMFGASMAQRPQLNKKSLSQTQCRCDLTYKSPTYSVFTTEMNDALRSAADDYFDAIKGLRYAGVSINLSDLRPQFEKAVREDVVVLQVKKATFDVFFSEPSARSSRSTGGQEVKLDVSLGSMDLVEKMTQPTASTLFKFCGQVPTTTSGQPSAATMTKQQQINKAARQENTGSTDASSEEVVYTEILSFNDPSLTAASGQATTKPKTSAVRCSLHYSTPRRRRRPKKRKRRSSLSGGPQTRWCGDKTAHPQLSVRVDVAPCCVDFDVSLIDRVALLYDLFNAPTEEELKTMESSDTDEDVVDADTVETDVRFMSSVARVCVRFPVPDLRSLVLTTKQQAGAQDEQAPVLKRSLRPETLLLHLEEPDVHIRPGYTGSSEDLKLNIAKDCQMTVGIASSSITVLLDLPSEQPIPLFVASSRLDSDRAPDQGNLMHHSPMDNRSEMTGSFEALSFAAERQSSLSTENGRCAVNLRFNKARRVVLPSPFARPTDTTAAKARNPGELIEELIRQPMDESRLDSPSQSDSESQSGRLITEFMNKCNTSPPMRPGQAVDGSIFSQRNQYVSTGKNWLSSQQEDSSKLRLPGTKNEIDEFKRQVTNRSAEVDILVAVPRLNALIRNKEVLERVYNRLVNDLFMWTPRIQPFKERQRLKRVSERQPTKQMVSESPFKLDKFDPMMASFHTSYIQNSDDEDTTTDPFSTFACKKSSLGLMPEAVSSFALSINECQLTAGLDAEERVSQSAAKLVARASNLSLFLASVASRVSSSAVTGAPAPSTLNAGDQHIAVTVDALEVRHAPVPPTPLCASNVTTPVLTCYAGRVGDDYEAGADAMDLVLTTSGRREPVAGATSQAALTVALYSSLVAASCRKRPRKKRNIISLLFDECLLHVRNSDRMDWLTDLVVLFDLADQSILGYVPAVVDNALQLHAEQSFLIHRFADGDQSAKTGKDKVVPSFARVELGGFTLSSNLSVLSNIKRLSFFVRDTHLSLGQLRIRKEHVQLDILRDVAWVRIGSLGSANIDLELNLPTAPPDTPLEQCEQYLEFTGQTSVRVQADGFELSMCSDSFDAVVQCVKQLLREPDQTTPQSTRTGSVTPKSNGGGGGVTNSRQSPCNTEKTAPSSDGFVEEDDEDSEHWARDRAQRSELFRDAMKPEEEMSGASGPDAWTFSIPSSSGAGGQPKQGDDDAIFADLGMGRKPNSGDFSDSNGFEVINDLGLGTYEPPSDDKPRGSRYLARSRTPTVQLFPSQEADEQLTTDSNLMVEESEVIVGAMPKRTQFFPSTGACSDVVIDQLRRPTHFPPDCKHVLSLTIERATNLRVNVFAGSDFLPHDDSTASGKRAAGGADYNRADMTLGQDFDYVNGARKVGQSLEPMHRNARQSVSICVSRLSYKYEMYAHRLGSDGGLPRFPARRLDRNSGRRKRPSACLDSDEEMFSDAPIYRHVLMVKDLQVLDGVLSSNFNKMLCRLVDDSKPYRDSAHMFSLKVNCYKQRYGDELKGGSGSSVSFDKRRKDTRSMKIPLVSATAPEEAAVKVSVLPLQVRIDCDTLAFIQTFFGTGNEQMDDVKGKMERPMTTEEEKSAPMSPTARQESPFQHLPATFFVRRFIFLPDCEIRVDMNYKVGVSVPILNQASFTLKKLHLRDQSLTLDALIHDVVAEWRGGTWARQNMPFVHRYMPWVEHLPGALSGVGPTQTFVRLFKGLFDLMAKPIDQYRQDGNIARGVKVGADSFAENTVTALLDISSSLFGGVEEFSSFLISTLSFSNYPRASAVPRGHHRQPQSRHHTGHGQHRVPPDIRSGVSLAHMTLHRGVEDVRSTITATRGNSSRPFADYVRNIPESAMYPPRALAAAGRLVSDGLRHEIRPETFERDKERYKHV